MKSKIEKKILGATLGMGVAGAIAMSSVSHAANPFAVNDIGGGYMVAEAEAKPKTAEAKCGEGKCGAMPAGTKAVEGKCGEGKGEEGKCGAKPADKKAAEGKCGEGKCGSKK